MAKLKITDDLCKKYLSLKSRIKKADKVCGEIKSVCVEHGDWQSTKHTLAVWKQEHRSIAVSDVVAHFGVSEKELEGLGLIKVSPYFQIKITERE